MLKKRYMYFVIAFFIGVIVFISRIHVYYAAGDEHDSNRSILLSGFVPFLSLLILIGGSILITLSYVSWRKYKGNKVNKQVEKRDSNN